MFTTVEFVSVWQVMSIRLVMMLQELVGDRRDIAQFYSWDPSTGVSFVSEIPWGQAISRRADYTIPFLAHHGWWFRLAY